MESLNSHNDKNQDEGASMGLFDHLDELRSRLVKSFLSILVIFVIAFSFSKYILNFLKIPLMKVLGPDSSGLHFTGPMDFFIADIKVSFISGIIFGAPIWIYQFWKFIEPALYSDEKKYVAPFIWATVLLFFGGIAFCYYVMLPTALEFLINMGIEGGGTAIITVKDYLSLVMILLIGFGLVFETPVILVLLAFLGLVNAETLSKNRKFVLVGILVVGAILTPPDPFSQMAMAIPTYLMFEISIIIIRLVKSSDRPKSSFSFWKKNKKDR